MSIRNSRSLSERTANVGVTIQKYPIRGEPHDASHLNAVTDITDRARSVPHTLPKTRAKLPRIYEFKLFLPPLGSGNFPPLYLSKSDLERIPEVRLVQLFFNRRATRTSLRLFHGGSNLKFQVSSNLKYYDRPDCNIAALRFEIKIE